MSPRFLGHAGEYADTRNNLAQFVYAEAVASEKTPARLPDPIAEQNSGVSDDIVSEDQQAAYIKSENTETDAVERGQVANLYASVHDHQHRSSAAADDIQDMADSLTKGSLRRISNGETVENPVVQCVLIKTMSETQDGGQRFRVVWNDSENFIQSMLPAHISPLVTEQKLRKGMFCRLKQYQTNLVKDKTILIALDLDVLEELGESEKVGNPVAIELSNGTDVKPQTENINGQNFYGQAQQAAPKKQNLPTRPQSSGQHGHVLPIEGLSPYSHKWTIKARCTHKGEIKTWHKNTGEGKLFSANFLDETGEIRATGFNDSVDQWYEYLQEGNVYYISAPCRVQMAKRQFSNVNNDYELALESGTMIEKAEDDGVPQVRYNFTSIEALQSVEKDTTIDCIAVLQSVGEVSEITSKTTSKPYQKRELTLVDSTGYNVRLTIWGNSAQSFDASPESVIAFKGVKVSDFGGRSLSLLSSGSMTVDPQIEDAYKLKGWFQAEGRQTNFQSHSNTMGTSNATNGGKQEYKTVAQIGDEGLGMNAANETDWFTLKATVLFVTKTNYAYPACQSDGCNKKVVETETSSWRCEKCDKTFPNPLWRYIINMSVADHTGQLRLTAFNDTGEMIMGMSADELNALMTEDDGTGKRVENIFLNATCKTFVFRCKAKMDTYQDQQRVRYQVQTASPLNYGAEATRLAGLIDQYKLKDEGLFVN